MSGSLHQLLAVEPDLRGASERIVAEAQNTFSKKSGHFEGIERHYAPKFADDDAFPSEKKEIVTTVQDKLDYVRGIISKYLDALAQKEVTNTRAVADVVVNGTVLLEKVPATLLLALESKLKELRSKAFESIPTLDPAESWQWSPELKKFRAAPRQTFKTKKVMKNHVKADATEKHPAQVEVFTEDVVIGTWTTDKISGMLTPAQKSDLLGRTDKLIQAVKTARAAANQTAVEKFPVADKIFSLLLDDLMAG